jgi:type III pantothenate kinase
MLLADIGNTRAHIFDGKSVLHVSNDEFIAKYKNTQLFYICVNQSITSQIKHLSLWKDISDSLYIKGEYKTMGCDRKALCLSHENGIFVDAGSAITVDIVKNGVYQGGFILPGIKAYLDTYKAISPALDIELNLKCDLGSLPLTTKDGISYGIIASIKALIDIHSQDLQLYLTGGDGKWLSSFFHDSIFDEFLIFEGMKKALKDKK